MAINYTISYTFSPSTTISSSQVNTNFSDNANTWNGLEAGTKTIAQIKVDADPTTSLQLTTKQYVDHYSTYRRPVLQYSSGTVVNIEAGINGTSGQAQILFPDGNLRTDSTSGRINCNLAQVAALSGSAQSGLRTGTVAANTWYAIYAVKTSDNSSNFVTVADVVTPTQANFSSLNTNFGASSWVYIGYVRYGDGSGAGGAIVKFTQAGNMTLFRNAATTNAGVATEGFRIASTSGANSLTWSYSSGTSGAVLPETVQHIVVTGVWQARGAAVWNILNSAADRVMGSTQGGSAQLALRVLVPALDGVLIQNGAAVTSDAQDILISGFVDGVLGVGSNPLL